MTKQNKLAVGLNNMGKLWHYSIPKCDHLYQMPSLQSHFLFPVTLQQIITGSPR